MCSVLRPRSFYTLRLSLGSGAVMLLKASVVRSYVHHLEKLGDGRKERFARASHMTREDHSGACQGRCDIDELVGVRVHPRWVDQTRGNTERPGTPIS